MKITATAVPAQPNPGSSANLKSAQPLDLRFRQLLGNKQWRQLPDAIRRRFSHHVGPQETVVYRGRVQRTRFAALGYLMAQVCRVIGAPLPLEAQTDQPSVVAVTASDSGGQFWSRQYQCAQPRVPQIIRSEKCFAGPTGLEEHIGGGVGIALRLHSEPDRLVFRSDHFFLNLFGWCLRARLPLNVQVSHIHVDDDHFIFDLQIGHQRIGNLIEQRAIYQELSA